MEPEQELPGASPAEEVWLRLQAIYSKYQWTKMIAIFFLSVTPNQTLRHFKAQAFRQIIIFFCQKKKSSASEPIFSVFGAGALHNTALPALFVFLPRKTLGKVLAIYRTNKREEKKDSIGVDRSLGGAVEYSFLPF